MGPVQGSGAGAVMLWDATFVNQTLLIGYPRRSLNAF